MSLERLILSSDAEGVEILNRPFRNNNIKGLYCDGTVALNDRLSDTEKTCVLAEELGHYHTTAGDIIDLNKVSNRKQELRARLWGYDKLIGLSGIVSCYRAGCQSLFEMAEHLDVTEEYLKEALDRYRSKYGVYARIENYVIYFEPALAVLEMI